MRNSITNNLFDRLNAQAQEAEVQGLSKIAEHLTAQLEKNTPREDNAFYLYATVDFEKDVEQEIWDAILRVADFHNIQVDAVEAQQIVEKFAAKLVREVELTFCPEQYGVGVFEPTLPGETKAVASLEVEEE